MISEKPWKVESVIRLAMELFASIAFGVLLLQGLQQFWVKNPEAQQKLMVLIGTVFFHGSALMLVQLFLQEHDTNWRTLMGWSAAAQKRVWLTGLAGWAVSLPVVWLLNQAALQLADLCHVPAKLQTAVEMLQKTDSPLQLAYFGLIAVVIAPVIEEVLFRGILYPVIKQQGYPRLAVVGTSLLFAATHANLVAFLPLAALAAILVLVYERTDSLLAPIFTHSLFNLANFMYVIFQSQTP
jgi:membrane protease YdiL (CAAX protease family)